MTLLEAMKAPRWFAEQFGGPEWATWRVFVAALFGLPLSDAELEMYRRHTGRTVAPTAAAREAWLVVGHRGGKSRIAALIAVWLATLVYRAVLAPGEVATICIIARDRKQANTTVRYIRGPFDVTPMLSRLVARQVRMGLELKNKVVIEVHTASFRSIRGYTIAAAILDELALRTRLTSL